MYAASRATAGGLSLKTPPPEKDQKHGCVWSCAQEGCFAHW